MTDVVEEWRSIPSFPCYEASSFGRIRSLPHITLHGHRRQSTVLSQQVAKDGYCVVTLLQGCKKRPYRVHLLVAEAFLGERPEGADVRHGPGGQQDNSAANLSYGTREENEEDKKRDGTFNHGGSKPGEENRNAKMTAEQVLQLRKLRAAYGYSQKELAERFGITQAAVSQILSRKTWTHL
jgi:predicted XRE-type DNA-binding protein